MYLEDQIAHKIVVICHIPFSSQDGIWIINPVADHLVLKVGLVLWPLFEVLIEDPCPLGRGFNFGLGECPYEEPPELPTVLN